MSYNDYLIPSEDDTSYQECPVCEGEGAIYFHSEGEVIKEKCTTCDGIGEIKLEADIDHIYERKFDK